MIHVVKDLNIPGFSRKPTILLLLFFTIFFTSCTEDKAENDPAPTPIPIPLPKPETRPLVTARLVPVGSLSQERSGVAVASAGGKLVIAGGYIGNSLYSSRVDIYDIASDSWATAELSLPRSNMATAVLNKKIYFAGGSSSLSGQTNYSGIIDIYDTETSTWTSKDLGMVYATMAGASAGNKVVFASGVTAHIYDAVSDTWTTAPLSSRPGEGDCCQSGVSGIAATAIGNTIYLAGGIGWEVHKAIDIYNTGTNQWSGSSLGEYKGSAAGIAIGNTNYWAGGETFHNSYRYSSLVEVRDMATGISTYSSLFQPNASFSAVHNNNTLVFFTGKGVDKSKFDIYDLGTKLWSVGSLPENIEEAGIISVDNKIYVAGGKVNGVISNQLRVLEF